MCKISDQLHSIYGWYHRTQRERGKWTYKRMTTCTNFKVSSPFGLWICMVITAAILLVTTAIITSAACLYHVNTMPSPSKDVHVPRPSGKNFLDSTILDNVNHSSTIIDDKFTVNTTKTNSFQHPEVKSWPKIFLLSSDPAFPVVCYAGLTLNITDHDIYGNGESNREEVISRTGIAKRAPKIFILSADPEFPVICQEGNIPPGLAYGETVDKEDKETNITCIRRDYEEDISAIFLHNAGPIESAWNVFNSSIPYGFWNVGDVDSIDDTKILKEAVVECEGFAFIIGHKVIVIGAGAAASLSG